MLVHPLLRRLAAEELGKRADCAAVRDPGGDVRPLPRVRALGEEPAKLVEARRRRTQDAVRMVVDERDPAQYFSK
jgi:hypothetical protein